MELSFRELKNRSVINIVDGSCLGHPCDIILDFPKGILTAIVVPGRKSFNFFGLFKKNEIVISDKNIVKIGSDVILVNLKCGEVCAPNTTTVGQGDREGTYKNYNCNSPKRSRNGATSSCQPPNPPQCSPPCPPPCNPPCPPPCNPPGPPHYNLYAPHENNGNGSSFPNCEQLFGEHYNGERYDESDY